MKKIVALIISIFCAIGLFGCSSIDYNAVIIKEGITYHQEWLDNNQVYDSFNFETHEWDNSSPKDRTYVITVQEDLDKVFKEFPSVDFENKMVIIWGFGNAGKPSLQFIRSLLLQLNISVAEG